MKNITGQWLQNSLLTGEWALIALGKHVWVRNVAITSCIEDPDEEKVMSVIEL